MALPILTHGWNKLGKFQTPAYDDLYKLFLRDYLAFVIEAKSLEFAKKIDGDGQTNIKSDQKESASLAEKRNRSSLIMERANSILKSMGYWLLKKKKVDKVTAYDKALIIKKAESQINPYPKSRRIALKTVPGPQRVSSNKTPVTINLGGHTYELVS